MSDDKAPVEQFALARHGLPLPGATRATMRGGHWLPAAARNPAVAPVAARAEPAPSAPEPTGEEPWWMEAAEWVPRETAHETERGEASTGHASREHADSTNASPTPTSTSRDASAPSPGASPTAARPPAPRGFSAREVVARTTVPATPQVDQQPLRDAAAPSTPDAEPTAQPVINEAAPAHPTLRPAAMHDTAASSNAPQGHTSVVTHTVTNLVQTVAPPEAPSPSTAALPPRAATAPKEVTPPSARPPVDQAPATIRITEKPIASSAKAQPFAAQQHSMGAPHATPIARALAPQIDMAALLAPAPRHESAIHIDRVAVTVQAPPPAPQSAPAATAASTRVPSPTRSSYRNPWAGYHHRRD